MSDNLAAPIPNEPIKNLVGFFLPALIGELWVAVRLIRLECLDSFAGCLFSNRQTHADRYV